MRYLSTTYSRPAVRELEASVAAQRRTPPVRRLAPPEVASPPSPPLGTDAPFRARGRDGALAGAAAPPPRAFARPLPLSGRPA